MHDDATGEVMHRMTCSDRSAPDGLVAPPTAQDGEPTQDEQGKHALYSGGGGEIQEASAHDSVPSPIVASPFPALTPKQALMESLTAPIVRELERAGITKEEVFRRLREEMDATDRKVFKSRGEDVVYSDPVPNHSARLAALDMAMKLMNVYPVERGGQRFGDVTINIVDFAGLEKRAE